MIGLEMPSRQLTITVEGISKLLFLIINIKKIKL